MNSIVHLITTINRGGAENQLSILVEQQVLQGNDVTVIFLKGNAALYERFVELGAKVESQFANKGIAFQLYAIRKFLKVFTGVLHAHLPRAELLASMVSAEKNFVVSRHNSEPFFPRAPAIFSRLLSRFVESRANVVICISESVANFLLMSREVRSVDKLQVLYYGFPNQINLSLPARHSVRIDLSVSEGTLLIGTISRLVEQKNIPCLMRSFREVKRIIPNSKLLIIGAGPLDLKLKLLASNLEISEDVLWVSHSDSVLDFLNAMDVFVLTSNYEGFGMVLLESLSARTPIVATNVSAIPEVLGSSYPFLARINDELNFADKILEINQSDRRVWFDDYASNRIKFFDPSTMAKKMIEIYHKFA
jgi:glycosyltransferase involved in cell wall biosynthesis